MTSDDAPAGLPDLLPPGWPLFLDVVLAGAGLLILGAYLFAVSRARAPALWAGAPERSNRLSPELIVFPLALFLIAHPLIYNALGRMGWAAANEDTRSFLTGVSAHCVLGVVSVLMGGHFFLHGLRGFLMGDLEVTRQLKWAVGGVLAAFPLCWASAELTVVILKWINPDFAPPEHDVLYLLNKPDAPTWLPPILWISALLIAPVVEEAFFRGLCQTALQRVFKKPLLPLVLVALFFGLSHYSQPHVVLPLAALGMVLGLVYEKTGSLFAPMVLHFLFNLRTMLYAALA